MDEPQVARPDERAAQEIKGDAQKVLGKAKGAIKSAADKVSAKSHEKL
jgi:uncharacterized protein YjbJ (UPF0337 family)